MNFFQQIWVRLKKKQRPHLPEGWSELDLPDGRRVVVDRETMEYLNSSAPEPTQQSLDAVLGRACSLTVTKGGASGGRPLGSEILFESREETELAGLRHALRIIDGPGGHCMCHGDPAIEFLDKSGNRLAVIGVHHGHGIRWSGWKDDAALVDGCGLLEWLAAHSVQYPLQDYQASQHRRAVAEAAWERWFAAMPPCLQPLLADQRESIGMVVALPSPAATPLTSQPRKIGKPATVDAERLVRMRQALQEAYPIGVQRAQVLFLWFGNGGGAWSGFAAYEQVVEDLLMEVPIDDVIRALDVPSLPRPLLEGAARFLAGWNFYTARAAELERLPDELRRRLLECSMDTADADKRARAEAAFRRQNE